MPPPSDEEDGSDDGEHGAEEVELGDLAGADQAGEEAADDGTDDAEAEGGEDAEVLLAGLEQAGQGSDDEAEKRKPMIANMVLLLRDEAEDLPG